MSNRVYVPSGMTPVGMSYEKFDGGDLMEFVGDWFTGQYAIKTTDGGYTFLTCGTHYDAGLAEEYNAENRFAKVRKLTLESE